MGFFGKLFGTRGPEAYDGMTPERRLEMMRKKESDSGVKQRIIAAQGLIGSTDSGNSKMAQARLAFSDLKVQRPLIWLHLVLSIYDQGHPIFDEVIGSDVRNALRKAQDELVQTPDESRQKLLMTIEKDIETRKLTSLKFLQDPPAQPMPHAMTMPVAPTTTPVAVNDTDVPEEKPPHKKKVA